LGLRKAKAYPINSNSSERRAGNDRPALWIFGGVHHAVVVHLEEDAEDGEDDDGEDGDDDAAGHGLASGLWEDTKGLKRDERGEGD